MFRPTAHRGLARAAFTAALLATVLAGPTTGGLGPAAAYCTPTTEGETRYLPYTADYVFWKATGA